MSYARKGLDDSHVYVFQGLDEAGKKCWVCHECSLRFDAGNTMTSSVGDMFLHLAAHLAIGEVVPAAAFERLRGEGRLGLFPLGQIIVTPGARAAVPPEVISQCLRRHVGGDFGELDAEDVEVTRRALGDGRRILSHYRVDKTRLYVITEADRSRTTVLLPEEY